jgi:hypothetical protein
MVVHRRIAVPSSRSSSPSYSPGRFTVIQTLAHSMQHLAARYYNAFPRCCFLC